MSSINNRAIVTPPPKVPTLSLVLPHDYNTEMTIDELLALTPEPRQSLSKRRMNIAYNAEAIAYLKREIEQRNESQEHIMMNCEDVNAGLSSAQYLVYSNGLLFTPEGEIATLEEYNLTDADIHRQLLAHNNQTGLEEPDECIILLDSRISDESRANGFATPIRTPVLLRQPRVVSSVSTDSSPLGFDTVFIEETDYEPVDLYISEWQSQENTEFIYRVIV